MGLQQLFPILTKKTYTLDLFFASTTYFRHLVLDEPIVFSSEEHHEACFFEIVDSTPIDESLPDAKHRNFYLGDYEKINALLNDIRWNDEFKGKNIDGCVEFFNCTLNRIIDEHIPLLDNKGTQFPPWFNRDLIDLIITKKAAHCKWKCSDDDIDKIEFKRLRSKCVYLSRKLYREYIENINSELRYNSKPFWKLVNSTRKNPNKLPNEMYFDNLKSNNLQESANLFSEFFSSVYTKSDSSDLNFLSHDDTEPFSLSLLQVHTTFLEFESSVNAGPDSIPQFFISSCWDSLKHVILFLFNISLSTGCFPSQWKLAHLVPIFKKGDKNNVENYRPISILSFLSKLFESVVSKYLVDSVLVKLIDQQHGFFPGRSIVTNLLLFNHNIVNSLNRNAQLDSIYIDFEKAFDSVDHSLLLNKLISLDLPSRLIKWFHSYLSDREQSVKCEGFFSDSFHASSGVPQGSPLGPLLFIIFINDISSSFQHSMILLYADDLKVFSEVSCLNDAINLQKDLDNLMAWARSNKLRINLNKCSVMSFSRKLNPISFEYELGSKQVIRVNECSDLGILYTSSFDFSAHVISTVTKASKVLGFIYRTTKFFFNSDSLSLLYNSLVVPILSYGSVIWSPYTDCNINLLESLHHKVLRYLCLKSGNPMSFTEHDYSHAMVIFNLPTIEDTHRYHDCLLVYKIMNGYINCADLSKLFHLREIPHNIRPTRILTEAHYKVDYLHSSSVPRMCRFWNSVPSTIRNMETLGQFKTNLKNFLFKI